MLPRSEKLTPGEWALVDAFHRLYYEKGCVGMPMWLGLPMIKTPFDLWTYQEVFTATRPDWVIESGTCFGTSAWYFAHILACLGHGQVLSVDITNDVVGLWHWVLRDEDGTSAVPFTERPTHPRLHYLLGDITEPETIAAIAAQVRGRVMVICDSNHDMAHVSLEMERLAPLVTPGCYLVVEDTNVGGHPIQEGPAPGPYEAVEVFLDKHREFAADVTAGERFLLSMHHWLYHLPQEDDPCPEP